MSALILGLLLLFSRPNTTPSSPVTRSVSITAALISPLFAGVPIAAFLGFSSVNTWYFGTAALACFGLICWMRREAMTFAQLAQGATYFLKTIGISLAALAVANGFLAFVADSLASPSTPFKVMSAGMIEAFNHMLGIALVLSPFALRSCIKSSMEAAQAQEASKGSAPDSKLHLVVDNTK